MWYESYDGLQSDVHDSRMGGSSCCRFPTLHHGDKAHQPLQGDVGLPTNTTSVYPQAVFCCPGRPILAAGKVSTLGSWLFAFAPSAK